MANRELTFTKNELSSCEEAKSVMAEQNQDLIKVNKVLALQLSDCDHRKKTLNEELSRETLRAEQCEAREGEYDQLLTPAEDLYFKEEKRCQRIIIDYRNAQETLRNKLANQQTLYEYFYWTGMVTNPADEQPVEASDDVRFCMVIEEIDQFSTDCSSDGTRTMRQEFCLAKQLQNAFAVRAIDGEPSM